MLSLGYLSQRKERVSLVVGQGHTVRTTVRQVVVFVLLEGFPLKEPVLAPFVLLAKCLKKQLQNASSVLRGSMLVRTNAYFVQQANTLQLGQPLAQTVLLEITHLAPGALSKKFVPQAPTGRTKGLQRVIFALLERILVLGQTSARCVMLAISRPLRVLPSV